MDLSFKEVREGLKVSFKDKDFYLKFPLEIWQSYPEKIRKVLFDNLANLLTICMPIVAGIKELRYNTAEPCFKNDFKEIVLNDIPSATEEYKNESTKKVIERFLDIKYIFDGKIKEPFYKDKDFLRKAIIPFSCGRDTLLSLGICNEINLNPVLVYVNDTVSPSENKIKVKFTKDIAKKFNLDFAIVKNEIENLNDFEFWNKKETCLSYSHLITSFNFLMLPFTHFYKAKYIVMGNESSFDFPFVNKEGFETYISPDQSSIGMKKQNLMISLMSNNNVSLTSVIKPLSELAITKILFNRYKELGKYRITCDSLDTSKESRWCQNCQTCCDAFLFMKAINFDQKIVGFKRNLFKKEYRKYYSLFNKKNLDKYKRIKEMEDEVLFAFYLAYKNKAKGYLIDKFKKEYLEEARKREDELYNKFFKIHDADIPNEIKNDVLSIYKEELNI